MSAPLVTNLKKIISYFTDLLKVYQNKYVSYRNLDVFQHSLFLAYLWRHVNKNIAAISQKHENIISFFFIFNIVALKTIFTYIIIYIISHIILKNGVRTIMRSMFHVKNIDRNGQFWLKSVFFAKLDHYQYIIFLVRHRSDNLSCLT